MRVACFIPARYGSKRIASKNTRLVGGVSLVQRAVNAACESGEADWCVVSTDDAAIMENAADAKYAGHLFHHKRPAHTATDHAQIESAIKDWARDFGQPWEVLVLLQPTSPFRTAAHVREALRLLEATGADSVVGVTVGHEHHFAGRLKPREGTCWSPSLAQPCPFHDGPVTNVHQSDCGLFKHWFDWQPFRDPSSDRPRTQDLAPRGHENGALYVTRRAAWEASCLRMSGHIVALPMTRWEGLDVDDETDLAVASALVAGGVAK